MSLFVTVAELSTLSDDADGYGEPQRASPLGAH